MSVRTFLRSLGVLKAPNHHGSAGWQRADPSWVGKWNVLTSESPNRKSPTASKTAGQMFVGTQDGQPVVIPSSEAARHGVIVGGSGTGKSRGYLIPNAAWSKGTSLVCTDPKSELWKLTSGLRQKAVRYAPTDPGETACFNWVPLCADPATAELCARALVESGNTQGTEQAWLDTEAAFLAGVFAHAATMDRPTPLTAYRLFTRQPIDSLIEQLLESPSEAAREQAMVFSQTQERMRGSIVPVVAAKLQFLRDDRIARFTSSTLHAPEFESLRRTPSSLYWCLREHDIVRLRPLTSLFFSLLLERLAHEDEDRKGVPVMMLLDEFANIGVIPGFETTIALARGRGVSLWLGLQSLSQLESRYGKANAQTILANCGTKIALSGLDIDSADYFSRSLGDETAQVSKSSRHGLLNASYSHSTVENARRLLTADEVRRIDADKAIVIVGNRRPMLLGKIYYDRPGRKAQQGVLGPALAETCSPKAAPEPPPMPVSLQFNDRRRVRRNKANQSGSMSFAQGRLSGPK